MSTLNNQQKEAIHAIDHPLLVIAGAGSGKTRVITHKIAYLLQQCQLPPKNIYAVTFTNKAAKEMASRVQQLLTTAKKPTEKIQVSTFHALGLRILKAEHHSLGLKSLFSLFDNIDTMDLLKALSENISSVTDDQLKNIQTIISHWKNDLIAPEGALKTASQEIELLAARFYATYQTTLQAYNAVDFDDLITLPTLLFQKHPAILERWQNRVRYLLVDEYQDTNTAQYQLIKSLTGIRQAFTVVGDDDQSVYGWRGAKPDNILLLQEEYPRLQVIKLEQNYRSTNTILEAANHLIAHNPHWFEKKLWSTVGTGDPIRVISCAHEAAEIERVVHEILAHKFRYRLGYENYAILYRSNYQARPLEQALLEQGIPYQISGGISFFARTEIKDLFAYFKLIQNQEDDTAFLRCINTPSREIGPATLEKLGQYTKQRNTSLFYACFELGLAQYLSESQRTKLETFAKTILSLSDALKENADPFPLIEHFVKEIGYIEYISAQANNPKSAQKKISHVTELLAWLQRLLQQENTPCFHSAIQKMALVDLLERQSNETPAAALQLLTLHAAKGLEFEHVFILGWEEGILPHKTSLEENTVEEERRLAYVGMTRAKKTLTLTYANQRKQYGEYQSTTPSRFLLELPQEKILWEGKNNPSEHDPQAERTAGKAHLSALKAMLADPQHEEAH